MPFEIVRNDITKMHVDAVVTSANRWLSDSEGVNGAVHKAAGKELLKECREIGFCEVGQAEITKGYNLPAKYIIHTVGPVWNGGENKEEELLRSCYRESLLLAKNIGCESVAFPLISSGVFGYPKDMALKAAVDEISSFLFENEMMVYIVVFSKEVFAISEKLFSNIKEYIDDNYTEPFAERRIRKRLHSSDVSTEYRSKKLKDSDDFGTCCPYPADISLDELLNNPDESFSQMLLRLIDEKGMKDSECYKKANVDRKLFSKIRNNVNYKPSKTTAVAFAVALELPLSQAEDLLKKAGFALSHSSKFDIIIEYFISHRNYDIFEINQALFAFDQSLLGV